MADAPAPLAIRRLTVRAATPADASRIAAEFRAGLTGLVPGEPAGRTLRLQVAPGAAPGTAAAQALSAAMGGGDGR
jgi:hypothetical protein